MHEVYRRFYALQAMRALLARESAALAPILTGVYGNSGLFIRPHVSADTGLPAHLVTNMVELAPCGVDRFTGTIRADSGQLPFANDSFQLLVAQHALEWIDNPDECAGEMSRVLAPEGVALLVGFNRFGWWRPWLMWESARGAKLRLRSAGEWSHLLARHQIDVVQTRFPGLLLPNDPAVPPSRYSRWLTQALARFGSSWLLLARKRRSTLTPLRLRVSARERVLNPGLASGAHRECA